MSTPTIASLSQLLRAGSIDEALWEFQKKVVDILYQAKHRQETDGDKIQKQLEVEREKVRNRLLEIFNVQDNLTSFLRKAEENI